MRYMKGALGYDVQFETMTTRPRVVCFIDSDWEGSLDDMQST